MLEGAAALAEAEDARDADGHVAPTLADVEAAAQQRVLAYDRAGDGHYDTVCAFIKSIRGNDPDARALLAGRDGRGGRGPAVHRPAADHLGLRGCRQRRSARRCQVAVAAAQALDWVGLPEAQYALAQATAYLATAPKSNRSGPAYWAAVDDVDAARLAARAVASAQRAGPTA